MTKSLFGLSLLILGLAYIFRANIAIFIYQTIGIRVKKVYISYILFAFLVVVLVLGMLIGSKVQTQYSNVSEGMKKIKPKNRPHPWFDIDTYF